jgi:hypothetical protein
MKLYLKNLAAEVFDIVLEDSEASLDFNIKIKLLKILDIPNLNIRRIVFINEEKDEEKYNIYEGKVIN